MLDFLYGEYKGKEFKHVLGEVFGQDKNSLEKAYDKKLSDYKKLVYFTNRRYTIEHTPVDEKNAFRLEQQHKRIVNKINQLVDNEAE